MKRELENSLEKTILNLQKSEKWGDFAMPEIMIGFPKDEKFGDYSTNIAMVLARTLKKNPLEIAENLNLGFRNFLKPSFDRIEVVAPGYINFYLSKKYLQDKVAEINKLGEKFGESSIGKGIEVNNEFISANPTGPLTVGNGRGGFYGDTLSRVLKKSGFEVTNEYYVNDGGGQVIKLGHSVLKDDEAVYAGDYIDQLNEKYGQGKDVQVAGQAAAADILEDVIKKTVAEKMRISFNVWTSEKKVQEGKYVDRAIEILKSKKLTYEAEGALWLKTTDFDDDKDRVLIKSDGQFAYFAGDCGYMLHKIERGFGRLVIGLGADHHGYIARLKATALALGFAGDFRFIIVQLVRIVKDGQEARMSKRAGNVVAIDDLIDKVGHDAARFFFLMYSPNTHMIFDLNLAEEKSQKNPVYYVQYAHARICSILKKVQSSKFKVQSSGNFSLLTNPRELSLIREINKFPELVEEISESYEVHKLPHYAIKLADKFHSFYNDLKVIDESDPETTGARLNLVNAVRIVLAETLRIIGVAAPNKM
ncbi:MAG TPA: arginine--tRNA ligase [Patescibacteria group bacterium]